VVAAIVFASAIALAGAVEPRPTRECPDCPELVVIPAGAFLMGSPAGEEGRFESEGPLHRVAVAAFALGKTEVTVEEFLVFLRQTGYQPAPCNHLLGLAWSSPRYGLAYPPGFVESPRQPAVCLSWDDAQAYIGWLNTKVACPARPNGNTPPGPAPPRRAGGGRRSAAATPIAMVAAAVGTTASSPPPAASAPIRSVSTTCWAMSGSGPRIAGTPAIVALPPTAPPGPLAIAAGGCCAAAHGATCPNSSARRPGAAAARRGGTSTIPATPASASPEVFGNANANN